MCDLEHALNPQLKHGRTIILTLGAPIKVASKLVAALTDTLAACLESGAEEVDVKRIILGNRVRFRIVNARFRWAAQLIGFVFTGDPSPINLANTMSSLYDAIAKPTSVRKPAKGASERWLVLAARDWIADIKTFRRAYSKMAPPHDYKRILIVPEGGQVEILTGDD